MGRYGGNDGDEGLGRDWGGELADRSEDRGEGGWMDVEEDIPLSPW